MTRIDIVKFWVDGADDSWETAKALYESGRYHHSLFFAQLFLEKLLKGLTYYLKDTHPLYTHDLSLLAGKCDIKLSDVQLTQLDEITTFNMSARYPEYKQEIYKRATMKYAQEWLDISRRLGEYFKTYLKK